MVLTPPFLLCSIGTSLLGFVGALWSPTGDAILGHGYGGSMHVWEAADLPPEPERADLGAVTFAAAPGVTGHFGPVADVAFEPRGR
jgi:elongator complex protein 2